MKPIIAIVLLLALSQVARGQDTTKFILDLSKKLQFITIRPHIVDTILLGSATIPYYRTSKDSNDRPEVIRVVTTSDWDEWVDSCKRDTIHAVPYEGEYLVDHGSYREMVSERQLEDRGYRFKYRWITNTIQPFEWDYVFLREPTLSGFMEFIRRTK